MEARRRAIIGERMAQQQSTSRRRRRRRRLRALAAAVSSGAVERARPWPGDPFTNRSANEPDPEASAALLHKLAQKPDGSVEPRELEELATRERAAAESRDYRLAAQLRDLQEVLRPSSLKLRDCMPPTVDEQYAFFLKQGFCVLPDVLAPPQLRSVSSRMNPPARRAAASSAPPAPSSRTRRPLMPSAAPTLPARPSRPSASAPTMTPFKQADSFAVL